MRRDLICPQSDIFTYFFKYRENKIGEKYDDKTQNINEDLRFEDSKNSNSRFDLKRTRGDLSVLSLRGRDELIASGKYYYLNF